MTVQEVLDSLTLDELKCIAKTALTFGAEFKKLKLNQNMTTQEVIQELTPVLQIVSVNKLSDELIEKFNKL
jgi:hypothetical protein